MENKQEQGEVALCRHRLIRYCLGHGLDLGCGPSLIKPDAIGIDLTHPAADMRGDARLLEQYPNESVDYIFSSHLLEEIEDTASTLKEWLRVIKVGGSLVLYQADQDTYFKIGDPRCNNSHKHHFSWSTLWGIIKDLGIGVELIHAAPPLGKEWSFELVVKKLSPGEPVRVSLKQATIGNIKILIVGGPAEDYIEKCLESIVSQDYNDWQAQIVLDPVGDKTYERAVSFANQGRVGGRISVHLNDSGRFQVANLVSAVNKLKPSDDDILVTIDADDWLPNNQVFSNLIKYYERYPELLVTHGSWSSVPDPNCAKNNRAYSEQDFKYGIRRVHWRGSHLRTFKYKVWKYIKDEDLRGPDGEYPGVAGDLAFMYPMLEMSGFQRVQFIPEEMYVYNQITPYNDHKTKKVEQEDITYFIKQKPPYLYLELL